MKTRSEILHAYPIGRGLDGFRDAHALNPLGDSNWEVNDEGMFKRSHTRTFYDKASLDAMTVQAISAVTPRSSSSIFDRLMFLSPSTQTRPSPSRALPPTPVAKHAILPEPIDVSSASPSPPLLSLQDDPTSPASFASNLASSSKRARSPADQTSPSNSPKKPCTEQTLQNDGEDGGISSPTPRPSSPSPGHLRPHRSRHPPRRFECA